MGPREETFAALYCCHGIEILPNADQTLGLVFLLVMESATESATKDP
jgi:hypothetical protein